MARSRVFLAKVEVFGNVAKHSLECLIYPLNKEEGTSALVGSHVGPFFLVDLASEQAENQQQFNPHIAPGRNQTQATSVGGERSHPCAITASHKLKLKKTIV